MAGFQKSPYQFDRIAQTGLSFFAKLFSLKRMVILFRHGVLLLLIASGMQLLVERAHAATLEVLEADPPAGAVLPFNGSQSLKIAYTAAEPIRIQAEGYFQGVAVKDISNPSPVYPAGEGEGIVWISYRTAQQIDEIKVTASDARWKALTTVSIPHVASWHPGAASLPADPWVSKLNAIQQTMIRDSVSQSHSSDSVLWTLLPAILFLSVPGYLVLQIVSLKLDGWKSLSCLPLLAMIPLLAYTVYAYAMQSNLWPLLLIFASPVALIYLLALRLVKAVRAR